MNALFSVIGYKPEEINTLTKRYQVFNLKHVVCDQSKPHEEEVLPAKKKKPRQRRRRNLASQEEEASPDSEVSQVKNLALQLVSSLLL